MSTHHSLYRCVAAVIVALAAIAPNAGVGNHYILPCGEKCERATGFAYIGNELSDYVTVVDTTTHSVVAAIDVGQRTTGVAVNTASTRVYAVNDHNLVVIDTATNAVVATINYQTDSESRAAVAVNSAGTRVYVTDQRREGIAVIDTATNTVIANVATGHHAFGIAVNPDGTRVYATSPYDDIVSVIDAVTDTLVANSPIDNPYTDPPVGAGDFSAGPGGMVVDPTGTRVYVANSWLGNQVDGHVYMTIIDAATNTIIANVPIGPKAGDNRPNLAMNAAGTRVYLSNGAIIDTASNAMIGTIPLPGCCLAIDPSGARIYAVLQDPPSLAIFDAESHSVVATVPLEGFPVAFDQFVAMRGGGNQVPALDVPPSR